ncbi:hypothetical protein ALC62_02073, partial [Cyphomyrmex costatus]
YIYKNLFQLIMEPLLTQQLTKVFKERLVCCCYVDNDWKMNGVIGFCISTINSACINNYIGMQMNETVQQFIKSFDNNLTKLTEKELNNFKEKLTDKTKLDDNFDETVEKHWIEVIKSEYLFKIFVSVEENEIVVDNLDAARSHTYLSATCVHGECTDDPYAWVQRRNRAHSRWPLSQKGLGNARTLRGVGGLFFPSPPPPPPRLECKKTVQKERERGNGRNNKDRTNRLQY